ncbi:MAG: hypothetical protein Ct9H300mP1_34860 [Planctomycetaceae bacterium]|nr:MAG: hypothetical protein Ct9H300mP1_34860 [Planctomycetaceae bacterium]
MGAPFVPAARSPAEMHPADYYALGAHRGGIDERWFASTTPAANEGETPDEGLSYCVHEASDSRSGAVGNSVPRWSVMRSG